jgi:hypothetical protein
LDHAFKNKRREVMKASSMVIMTAFLISAAVPVFAETAQDREQCAISAGSCLNKAEVVEKRMKKMHEEMKKGVTYPPEEMKVLEQKIQDVMDQMDKMGINK